MDIIEIMAMIIGIGFFISILFLVLLFVRREVSIWNLFVMGAVGVFLSVCVDNLLNLYVWIEIGLDFGHFGATLFLIGMISMIFVMVINFVASRGRTLVR